MPDPSVLQTWNRLEPRPRTSNFSRSLRAEVRDALWMLTRQWQMGEWNGEDTGTAAFVHLDMQTSHINRVSKKSAVTSLPYDETIPLECVIERERVTPDLLLRAELGRQFLKMLSDQLGAAYPAVKSNLLAMSSVAFTAPATPDDFSNPELWQATLLMGSGQAVDGYKILTHLRTTGNTVSNLPGYTAGFTQSVNATGVSFVSWYNRVYAEPSSAADTFWQHQHLEYQFACSAPDDGSNFTVLAAEEYYQGNLDWYSFDLATGSDFPALVSGSPDTSLLECKPLNVIPSKLVFGGMPAQRWWEMEDRRVDFGGVEASTTDTARLLVAEFGTMYSNDWMLFPYDVPTGSICRLRGALVTDVFGQTTIVSPAAKNGESWNMYTLSTEGNSSVADPRLFVAPAIDKLQESDSLEQVNFMRDEMANMVWAVESIVPNGVSGGEPGVEAARRLVSYLESITTGTPPTVYPNDAQIKFNIMSEVPENWIPFIPVKLPGTLPSRGIQLQRAAMPRVINGLLPTERVRPKTSLLIDTANPASAIWPPSYVYEEEVPRSGAILMRTWQRARTESGRVILWLGRRKQNGRGESNSGLRFDYLTAK